MSMNLHAKYDGKPVELWQTPTHITYMCLMTHKGMAYEAATQKAAHRALRIYCEWVKTQNINVIKTEEDQAFYDSRKAAIAEHLVEIIALLKGTHKLEVYTL